MGPAEPAFAAVVLAGGTAVRMDGVDKAGVEHAGRTLLEHALAAVSEAVEVVVAGDGRRQLAGVVHLPALDRVRPDDVTGLALHRLLAPLDLAAVPAEGEEALDVDTWADLRDLGESPLDG